MLSDLTCARFTALSVYKQIFNQHVVILLCCERDYRNYFIVSFVRTEKIFAPFPDDDGGGALVSRNSAGWSHAEPFDNNILTVVKMPPRCRFSPDVLLGRRHTHNTSPYPTLNSCCSKPTKTCSR